MQPSIAQIEAGGQNEFEDERHAVEVNECQLTTYRWKKVEGEGWVLWSSFEMPMLTVTLNDAMAMMPEMKLSDYEQVTVGARVSKAGTAIAQSGDLFGEISPARVGEPVVVVIDQRKP